MQLDRGEKGFSFSKEGPLDMRMDPTLALTAEEIVNKWSEKDLGELFRECGEAPNWRTAAKAIVEARKKKRIRTTTELAGILTAVLGTGGKKRLHPATLVFQALRICVNQELEKIEEGLKKAIDWLAPGGRIGVISFHSLEDRIVKNVFREASSPPGGVSKRERAEARPPLCLLTKKPLTPKELEIRKNPRSRSAKVRFAEKVSYE